MGRGRWRPVGNISEETWHDASPPRPNGPERATLARRGFVPALAFPISNPVGTPLIVRDRGLRVRSSVRTPRTAHAHAPHTSWPSGRVRWSPGTVYQAIRCQSPATPAARFVCSPPLPSSPADGTAASRRGYQGVECMHRWGRPTAPPRPPQLFL